jgi:hypothetical protein
MTTMAMTDSQVIAKVLRHYVAGGHDQELKDVFVEETKRTFGTRKRGWQVFFAFTTPTSMGTAGITYELNIDGDVKLFESM